MNKEGFKAHLLTIAKERPDCLFDLMMDRNSVVRVKNKFYLKDMTYYASEFRLRIILNACNDGKNVNVQFKDMSKSVKIEELGDLDFSNPQSCSDNIVKEYIRLDAQNKQIVIGINNSFITFNHEGNYSFFRAPGNDYYAICMERETIPPKTVRHYLRTWKSYYQDVNYYLYIEFEITEEFIKDVELFVSPYLTEQQQKELTKKLKNTKEKKGTTAMMDLFPYFCRLFDSSADSDTN